MKGNIIKQKNNLLKENYILKIFDNNNNFVKNFIGNKKEIINFLTKNEKLLLSENYLLSKIFLSDLLEIKIKNNDFIYL